VFTRDLKVRVQASGLATYPDVAVVCGDLACDTGDENAVTNPMLLVEVLSPSTEAYDRGEKWAHCRRIASLRAYVLVQPIAGRLEVFERDDTGEFVHRMASAGEVLPLHCLAGGLAVDPLFAAAL
jgi:Uma2 family endonuclease